MKFKYYTNIWIFEYCETLELLKLFIKKKMKGYFLKQC